MKPENLLLTIAGVLLGIKLLSKSPEEQAHDEIIRELKNKPVPNLPGTNRPPVPTLSKAEAKAIAERQYIAMNRPGTDEDELFRSLNGLNGADLRMVFEAFGLRNYFTLRRPLNLFGWYVEELDPTELSAMRIYWHKSGITF